MRKSMLKTPLSKIVVQYDCGFGNSLYIRGEGASTLSWGSGIALINLDSNIWIWETERPFTKIEFKILINDTEFEIGPNHTMLYGESESISPQF